MVLALNDRTLPKILFVSDDSDIKTALTQDKEFSDYNLLFTQHDAEIFDQFNSNAPQLAIIDSSVDGCNSLELINTLKQQGRNIPIILLIDPENLSHLQQATQATVDSVFTKPIQSKQLLVSIQFHLLRHQQNQHRYCMPRRCSVVTQNLASDISVSSKNACSNVMDKQGFMHKLDELIEYLENEDTSNACVSIQIVKKSSTINKLWYKESFNLKNRFANYIQQQIRFGDLFAIDSGYQYLLLFPDLDRFTVTMVVHRIIKSLSCLIKSIDKAENLTVCAGVTIFDKNSNTEQVLAEIDSALRDAAKKESDNYIIKNLLDSGCEKNTQKVSYANIIQDALRDNTFFLHYQPIMALSDFSIRHYEALIRLLNNDGNYIQPLRIISAAENSRLIKDIDIRVLDMVMKKLVSLDLRNDELSVSVNLSGTHFGDKSLLNNICVLIDYYGINPSSLVFEMTETAAIKDLESASRFISSLKDLGCQFGLDDFGTGYASFSYLRALPVDYLKIDGIFVKEIINNTADQLFVRAIVDVAQGMGVKTIAECVEDKDTLDILTSIGIDFAQGYYIGHPDHLSLSSDRIKNSA
jgi:EAL domain-containing protein (putative c-di-GMP-specific phosphodiesterase class I)/DNA-binding response OmpR family regulator